jgi:alpha-L-fucosidase
MRKLLLSALVSMTVLVAFTGPAVEPPAPYGAIPTERQLAWHEHEFYGFIHFTMNTFTGKEWGYGDESLDTFNPSDLDVKQWVRVAKESGMTGLILTCKHHDGFSLWPSKFTEHSVKNTPYKNGEGDIVGELAAACEEAGLFFGVYLSPWDRNHPEYGRPAYVDYFRNQLRELLTDYGTIQEVWFDGANGGDGYYGGARETRKIDRAVYYDWKNTWSIVRELQPSAILFSDIGPDIRWVGNEKGFAGEPSWATYTPHGIKPGVAPAPGMVKYKEGINGHADGELWLPAEVDVSIRPGWFYHEEENDKVRTPENLLKLYYQSVGRGASFLLNLPPDQRGLVHENDVASLKGLRALLDETFDVNLAAGAKVSGAPERGGDPKFAAANLLDGDGKTYWATDDGVTKASVVIELDGAKSFNNVLLQEYIALGQRVREFSVDAWVDGKWTSIAKGTSIGYKRIIPTESVTTSKVRLNIDGAAACPALSSFELYAGPGNPL